METEKDFYMPVAIHPGENVREWMEENGMTAAELASRAGISEVSVRRIVAGLEDITPESAAALERGTSMSANFLLRFQQHYEEDLLRLYDDKGARDFARLTGQVWILRGRPVPKAALAPAGV